MVKTFKTINMLSRALDSGIYADYLFVDSWYAKPNFINEVKQKGIDVITRVANSNKIWQFADKCKTLESLYVQANKTKASKLETTTLSNTLMCQPLLHINCW